jgi:hypothetical protein
MVLIDLIVNGQTCVAHKAIKHLKPSKCVGADGIPSFIIKGCSHISIQGYNYIALPISRSDVVLLIS